MKRALGGLFRRMVLAAAVLLLIVGGAFSILLISISEHRATAANARHTGEVFTTADDVHRLVVEMQAAQLQYTISRNDAFLSSWQAAHAGLAALTPRLEQLAVTPAERSQAQRIAQVAQSYADDYSAPALDAAQRGDSSASSMATLQEGDRRIGELRAELDTFRRNEQAMIIARDARADRHADREIIAVVAGMAGSLLIVVAIGWYQARLMIGPIRRAAVMANRLAGGDFTPRMPETGTAEIGQLERSFNVMATTLQRNHDELAQFVDTQTALRRIATLVARGVLPAAVMETVATELARLIGTESVRILRYESDGTGTIVAAWGCPDLDLPPGRQVPIEGDNIASMVLRTGCGARIDSYQHAAGPLAAHLREHGIRATVGAPIHVEGRLWGVVAAATTRDESPPPDTEARLTEYTDLIGTAIANTQARADLVESRARFVLATDQARRRIERNLHDGVQQRLISVGLEVRRAEASVPPELSQLREQLSAVVTGLTDTVDDVREISRGVHPAIVTESGLRPALRALARRSAVPVHLDVQLDSRLPEPVEVAAYYVVAEALTNAAKYANASLVAVSAAVDDGHLHLSVRDDGVGGAEPEHGSGLLGLTDRVEALGGTLMLDSPPGGGTCLEVRLPLDERAALDDHFDGGSRSIV
ncbi:HAMP domain-containing protein [Dactylosporangium sp. CA-139066]|uniref:HAMP domain-containing protein n=1 Tax=Dactylosporangium sp. CA-139066 TaxID=3239930 RepID=UPI003D92DC52